MKEHSDSQGCIPQWQVIIPPTSFLYHKVAESSSVKWGDHTSSFWETQSTPWRSVSAPSVVGFSCWFVGFSNSVSLFPDPMVSQLHRPQHLILGCILIFTTPTAFNLWSKWLYESTFSKHICRSFTRKAEESRTGGWRGWRKRRKSGRVWKWKLGGQPHCPVLTLPGHDDLHQVSHN